MQSEFNKQLSKIAYIELMTERMKSYINKPEFEYADVRNAYIKAKNITKLRNKMDSRTFLFNAVRLDLIRMSNPLANNKDLKYYFTEA